ncbi:NarK/NasA family nitrate transporter [Asticcacaulis sp. AND118]|uniref:nitrate/nitrite transporter n=1 Tax=Asticcacaulis sp. AND118 TaxID=2840468 RepID=UPI001CFFB557|nr:nitrate/nitrite transporter [Asticcacaulis sp. AND118]UDF04008.1 NarK/NasA family nitrate transporter [Asticcacaulis sp. AND118]
MISKDFLKAGHSPTLFSAFLYFDMSFMVWVLLGALGVQIAADLGLTPAQKGFMVAVPILTGALLRLVAGVLVDRIGPKKTGAIGQAIVITGLLLAFVLKIDSYAGILMLAGVLGVAGASFAVALPLASRWYPPQYQGVALGIAGAGNSGTVFASLFAPSLAKAFGWTAVFGFAALPLIAAFIFYLIFARDAPNPPAPKRIDQYFDVLKQQDAWWFLLFYGVSFGGFVGLSSSLNIYFNSEYGLDPVKAGFFTAACVFAGSLFRPVGGSVADRIGGIRTLSIMYVVAAIALIIISFGLPTAYTALLFLIIGMGALGMANGAVFQLVPQRFRAEIGVMTGLVGMFGGIGGFYLATSLGLSKQALGTYQPGLIGFAALALVAFGGLTLIKRRWRTTWGGALENVRI